jgi:hypothetical protein
LIIEHVGISASGLDLRLAEKLPIIGFVMPPDIGSDAKVWRTS